jgi:hypothetical protein
MEFTTITQRLPYTGKELRGGWVAENSGIEGDAAVGFIGPCRVANEDLVDLDDARAGTFIEAAEMAHVIAEFSCDLRTAVLRQRLLVSILCEYLAENGRPARRSGDDVYYKDRKLTVSIAAPAAASCVIHLGINVDPAGAPVPAVGLAEMGIDAGACLQSLLERFASELESCRHAEGKVREVP